MAAPVLSNVSPADAAELSDRHTAQAFDVTDADGDLGDVVIVAKHRPSASSADAYWEAVFATTEGFSPLYADESTVSAIANGQRFSLKRRAGWPEGWVGLWVFAVDAGGGVLRQTVAHPISVNAVAPAYPPSGVIERVAQSVLLAKGFTHRAPVAGETLRESSYRLLLEGEPDSSIDGRFYVEMTSASGPHRAYGRLENIWQGRVVVRVGFFVGGGDRSAGDRKSVAKRAADTLARIADVVENPSNYNSAATGVRSISFSGEFSRAEAGDHHEVWEVPFDVEWVSGWYLG